MLHHHVFVSAGLGAAFLAVAACGGAPVNAPSDGVPAGDTGGAGGAAASADAPLTVTPIPSPAGPGSGEPGLASADGRAYLSWLERRDGDREAFLFAVWDGVSWTSPGTIAEGVPFFVNWADTPSILPMADGTLVAHWLEKAGGETYAYHVMISRSSDGGATWSAPEAPHDDRSATEHGFVSLVDLGPGRFGAAWLDGRKYGAGSGSAAGTALMFAEYRDGTNQGETVLDPLVCDCCQTAAVAAPDGVVIAYRDRSPEEVRDISRIIVPVETRAANPMPTPLSRDGWTIAGCPVNGPALAVSGARVAAAWFTEAGEVKRIYAALSSDGGVTFSNPIQLDLGQPAGRVDAEWLADGRALVTWIEDGTGEQGGTGEGPSPVGAARIMARAVNPGGTAGVPFVLTTTTGARASGFPRITRVGGDLLMAWTDPAAPPRVRLLRIGPPSS